jgi:hypothetical protein
MPRIILGVVTVCLVVSSAIAEGIGTKEKELPKSRFPAHVASMWLQEHRMMGRQVTPAERPVLFAQATRQASVLR